MILSTGILIQNRSFFNEINNKYQCYQVNEYRSVKVNPEIVNLLTSSLPFFNHVVYF